MFLGLSRFQSGANTSIQSIQFVWCQAWRRNWMHLQGQWS